MQSPYILRLQRGCARLPGLRLSVPVSSPEVRHG